MSVGDGGAGTGKLEHMTDLKSDVVGLDWATDIGVARRTLGAHVKVQGNLDPMVLFGPEEVRRRAASVGGGWPPADLTFLPQSQPKSQPAA